MDLDIQESVHEEGVVSWLENAIEHAQAQSQGKLLGYLECVRDELTEMRYETGFAANP
jgi:hypothetical protein